METMIFLVVANLIALLALGRGATRSAAGYVRLLIGVAAAIGGAVAIALLTGETRMTGSAASQAAAGLALLALASVLTVAIATVRFAIAAVAGLVVVLNDREASRLFSAWLKAENEKLPTTAAFCRKLEREARERAEKATRWLYADSI